MRLYCCRTVECGVSPNPSLERSDERKYTL
ncbi:hypothetical protein CGRA01v4_06170 [Colletotrichum graminicola]|nr:hypothetical protein CGRA01v4_06170 [Colletotrichum graminicola]